jgi:hypothetical protein
MIYAPDWWSKWIIAALPESGVAFFDPMDHILFTGEDGAIKRMDESGGNITTVAEAEPPYYISEFLPSPDFEKIAAVEEKWVGGYDYWTNHYFRYVMMNADGTDRVVLTPDYLGDWNDGFWNPLSDRFVVYFRIFNGLSGSDHEELHKYVVYDFSTGSIEINDLSNSDLGQPDNPVFYTTCGTFLSVSMELYDAQTGDFLADVSSRVPPVWNSLWGWDDAGDLYFANLDGSNFRKFDCSVPIDIDIKPGSDPNCFNLNGKGVIPVAILGSPTFDVDQIDVSSLKFNGLDVQVKGNETLQCAVESVNGDEYWDLVCQFVDDPSLWVEGDSEAELSGRLFTGAFFTGKDAICIVP